MAVDPKVLTAQNCTITEAADAAVALSKADPMTQTLITILRGVAADRARASNDGACA